MSKITEKFESVLREKTIPLRKQEIKNGQFLYNGRFQIRKNQALPFGVVFDNKDAATVDYQIVYHKLAYITNFDKKNDVLQLINELNQMKSGYYRLCIGGDGEVYMRLLARTSEDILPVYEMLVMGATIAKNLIPKIEEVAGSGKPE